MGLVPCMSDTALLCSPPMLLNTLRSFSENGTITDSATWPSESESLGAGPRNLHFK